MLHIADLAARIASRELSVERLVADTLDRVARVNPACNAFITVLADRALADARRLDGELSNGRYRGPLHGVPVTVKDLVDVEGTPTTAASRVRAGHLARADAPVAARLRAAGAVIIGKTNLHEFAYGTTSEDSAYGPVRNPRDLSRSAGGSSGGSAAAIAAGLCAGSVGTDTGGSIRIPSAACAVVGLKPTYGELPADGVVPLSRSLDHVGPMAADVPGVWALYLAMAGREASLPDESGARPPRRIAIPRRYFMEILESAVRDRFEGAIERLRQAGASTTDVEIPDADLIPSVYLHIQLPESSAYHAATLERDPSRYSPAVRMRLEMGRHVLAEDYVRALGGREVLREEVDRALDGADVLALPTLPLVAPRLGQATATIDGVVQPVRNVMLRLTQLFDITGHPAISIPLWAAGSAEETAEPGTDGEPSWGSLQLVGRRDRTEALLKAALGVERALSGGARLD